MRSSSTRKPYRPMFEFQRGGPYTRGSAAHKPDLTIAINRPSKQQLQQTQQSQQLVFPSSSRSIKSPRTPRRTKNAEKTLDIFAIAEACGTIKYSHITSLDLSGKNLNTVDQTALSDLNNLVKLDLSENYLKLEPFGCLPKLEELDFSCNNLYAFNFDRITCENPFGSLKKLNLNFNSINNSLDQFANIPNLSYMTITNNKLTFLPNSMGKFEKLEYLDLSFNRLYSNESFIALAALPNLTTLILDNNDITSIPNLQYGFSKLNKISLKNNKIEVSIGVLPLGDLESLQLVDITNNPINVFKKEIDYIFDKFSLSNITLIHNMEFPSSFKERAPRKFPNLVKVGYDPLLLPKKELRKRFHSDSPKAPLQENSETSQNDENENTNKIQKNTSENVDNKDPEDFKVNESKMKELTNNFQEEEDKDDDSINSFNEKKSTQEKVESDVFMTDFTNIAPTPLPKPQDQINDEELFSIWKDVPVIQKESRKLFSNRKAIEKYNDAFKKLKFLVENPEVPLKSPKPKDQSKLQSPRNTPQLQTKSSVQSSQNRTARSQKTNYFDEDSGMTIFSTAPRPKPRSKSTRNKPANYDLHEKLEKKQKMSKNDVLSILKSMELKLDSAEETMDEVDDEGISPIDRALDQTNFFVLNRQYESIRAEIVGTLRP